jgi:hypothetical protein
MGDGEVHGKGMLLDYARVLTLNQNLSLERDPLAEAGARKFSSNRCPALSRSWTVSVKDK